MYTEPMNLSDVKAMIDAYRDELVRAGHSEQALQLKGLDFMDAADAGIALSTLRAMPSVAQTADCVKKHLIQMLELLLKTSQLAA